MCVYVLYICTSVVGTFRVDWHHLAIFAQMEQETDSYIDLHMSFNALNWISTKVSKCVLSILGLPIGKRSSLVQM
jgi:hypothetical protein